MSLRVSISGRADNYLGLSMIDGPCRNFHCGASLRRVVVGEDLVDRQSRCRVLTWDVQISPYGRWTSARFETPDGIRIEDPRQAPKDADQEDVAPEDAQCPPCVSAEREQNSPSLLQRTANGQRVNSESPAAAKATTPRPVLWSRLRPGAPSECHARELPDRRGHVSTGVHGRRREESQAAIE